jgi:hypothetical protein
MFIDNVIDTYRGHKLDMTVLVSDRIFVVDATKLVGFRFSRMLLPTVGA